MCLGMQLGLVWLLLRSQFIAELARVCKPGGRILIVTWCHRVLEEGETQLKPDEQVKTQSEDESSIQTRGYACIDM